MEQDHKKFMQMAIELSRYNVENAQGGPFGAVVVKDGEVVARSANRVVPTNDPTAHAEVAAIRLACQELGTFNLDGCVIYTSCEPCPMCLGAIYWARINKVYYANTKKDAADIGFDDHFIYDELELPMANRKLPFEQMMRGEALQVFDQWRETTNKTDY
ncbi:nucleoside deaminase [Mucilaginibacter conchicola]|uniref:Nucleoside deaminase n=2 Tax=Mucilaginibacter conchicola TaxID=2303333 RepID=A0A372P261_9SPHI|nr:nucleoside deaminase [Mucilaginibacter conchicola]RFZ95847.1 nucleoside deaminase [Mucilaginibacter conchicola]